MIIYKEQQEDETVIVKIFVEFEKFDQVNVIVYTNDLLVNARLPEFMKS